VAIKNSACKKHPTAHALHILLYIKKKNTLRVEVGARRGAAHFFMMKISIGSNRLPGSARATGFLAGKVRGNLLFILQNLNSIADAGKRMVGARAERGKMNAASQE
jgi:hypothetical protein